MDYWTAFILGLVGSLHCAGMCGPLALALPHSAGSAGRHISGRLAYNLGRIITYAALGIVFGALGKTLLLAGIQRWVSISLGLALVAGLAASRTLAFWTPVIRLVERLKSNMAALLGRRTVISMGMLGLLNGLLPCGLVYVAGAGATLMGGVLSSVGYMSAFGAGTVPMMLGISLSGKLVPMTLRVRLARAIPVSVFLLGILLILRGLSLGIPYVSPDLSGDSCCAR